MNDNIEKRILISAVSNKDPYSIKEIKDKQGNAISQEYSDGSLLSIIRKYKKDNKRINEAYIYLTLETAISESMGNTYSKAIKNLIPEIKIHFIPEGIIEEVENQIRENCSDIIEDNQNMKIRLCYEKLKSLKHDKAIKEAHKFGKLYGVLNNVIDKIKITEKSNYEIIFNLSSGTSAMQSDIYMTAITTREINSKMIQVASPNESSNWTLKLVDVEEESLKRLEQDEDKRIEIKGSRAKEELMVNTQKIILLESIEESFRKNDYAGVYNSLISYKNIIQNKDIIRYAQNLYYRYIGNQKKAENGVYTGNIKREELYPIIDDKDFNKDIDYNQYKKMVNIFMYSLERLNILKVKVARDEINDWLLIAESTIESLYKKIIYKLCKFDIDTILDNKDKIIVKLPTDFVDKNGNEKAEKSYYADKINVNTWNEYNYHKLLLKGQPITDMIQPNYLIKQLLEQNGKNINAFVLKNMLFTIWENTKQNIELKNSILVLDELRNFRNIAAHTEEFMTREKLNVGFKEQVKRTNSYRIKNNETKLELKYNNPINVIKEAEDIIYDILVKIMPSKYLNFLDQELDVYNKIENNIINLLRSEIV